MKMTDPKSPKGPSPEELMNAIPKVVKNQTPPDQLQKMVQEKSTVPVMSAEDYSKMVCIENLPSKNLLYPEGAKIYGRHLDVGELKKLSSVNINNVNIITSDIIRSSIKGVKFEDILIDDKLYLILWMRANSFPNSGYSVPFTCYKCQKESDYDFKVDDININFIKEENITSKPLPLSNGDVLTFKYLTIGDEQNIEKFKGSVRNLNMNMDETDLSYAAMISSINGDDKKWMLDKYNYVKSSPEIYGQIKSWIKKFTFGVTDVMTVTCNSCGGTAPVAVSFREEFMLPDFKFPSD
jgi:hypothetical protein